MKIKMRFLGAAQNVTGARFLTEHGNTRFLVDCGYVQERQFRSRNWDPFPVDPASIDAVLLTHAHLDHCGYLPKLVKDGFKGRIICTEATAEIAKIIMLDSGKIQEEDAKYKARRHAREKRKSPRPVVPLYTVQDAEAVLPLFETVKYKKPVVIGDGIIATMFDAGHVLGSSIIRVKIEEDGERRTILFSGDIGRPDRPIISEPTMFEEADYVLIESTYGDRDHEPTRDVKRHMGEIISQAQEAGGKIVVPSFALERSQEVLYHVNQLLMEKTIEPMKIYLDSPMASRITEVFKNHPELFDDEMTEMIRQQHSPFRIPGLELAGSAKESKAIKDATGSFMVIAGSGMCTGGRVKHHLVNYIEGYKNTIMFVGYQAFGTLGRRIVDGEEEEVRILGNKYKINARIERVRGFSAHADRNELLQWLQNLRQPPRRVFVVHGEGESALAFGKLVREKAGYDAMVPEYGDEVILD